MSNEYLDIEGLDHYTKLLNSLFMSGTMIELEIPQNQWDNNICVIENEEIKSSKIYAYFVVCSEGSRKQYVESNVRALDVDVDGYITFKANRSPAEDLYVNILKMRLRGEEING